MANQHSISWFGIPTTDIDRAQKFYETILDMEMVPKTEVSPGIGFMAVLIDTEGNRGALHSVPV